MGGYYHCYEYSLKISKKLYTNHSFPRIGDFHKVVPPIPKQRWEFFSITNCFFCEILVHNMILKDIWRLKETSSFNCQLNHRLNFKSSMIILLYDQKCNLVQKYAVTFDCRQCPFLKDKQFSDNEVRGKP